MEEDDWRLDSPGADLAGHTFRWAEWTRPTETWDHDHCEFCWAKITDLPKPVTDGHLYFKCAWVTLDQSGTGHWVCPTCLRELASHFDLRTSAA